MLQDNFCSCSLRCYPRQHLGLFTANKRPLVNASSPTSPWCTVIILLCYTVSGGWVPSFVIMCVEPCFTVSKLTQEAYFPWCMPQASCCYWEPNYWSEMLLELCISYANTPICIIDKATFFPWQHGFKSCYCLRIAWIIFAAAVQNVRRLQCIVYIISWCWHLLSTLKKKKRNELLKVKVIIFKVANFHRHIQVLPWLVLWKTVRYMESFRVKLINYKALMTFWLIIKIMKSSPICDNLVYSYWGNFKLKEHWILMNSLKFLCFHAKIEALVQIKQWHIYFWIYIYTF